MQNTPVTDAKRAAMRMILALGLISLFGDIVYEGARSVNGPYLKVLAANAAVVGFVAGAGEFLGYALRLLTGYISDKTRSYWVSVFLGYGLIVCVPLLSLTGFWQMAALLIIMERIGKAIRSPGRDTLVSHAGAQVGTGMGFGIHEALDQLGALTGPLIFTVFFALSLKGTADAHNYRQAYSLLWLPFAILMLLLVGAFIKFSRQSALACFPRKENPSEKLTPLFWIYTVFIFLAASGFANFILIAYHFKAGSIFTDAQIPLLYALAMGVDGIAALAVGKGYDLLKAGRKDHRAGLELLVVIPLITGLLPFMVFFGGGWVIVAGIILWGVVMGVHETIMRSAIADITPINKRGLGYGIFNTSYGLAMFIGASLQGLLYSYSLKWMLAFSICAEAAALAVFILLWKRLRD